MEQKIHYTAGSNSTYAGVFILENGKDIEYIVIDHIEWREKEKVNGVDKASFVAIFKPNPYTSLPFLLNKTNKERLLKAARVGSFDLLTIKNFPVRLTYEPTKIGDGLRISKLPAKLPTAPAPKPKPELTSDKFDAAVAFLQKPGSTVEKLRESYAISAEMEKKLMEKCKDLTQGGGAE